MATTLKIERVTALPETPAASTMYIVKSAESPFAEVYFTSTDGQDVRHVINKAEIQSLINQSVADFSNIEVVADIAARDLLAPTRNLMALVIDATGDATVAAGAATYVFSKTGGTWTKIAEYESLDLSITWAALQGKPTSSVAAIDDAVSKAHTHANLTQLDKVGEDGDGTFTYGGQPIRATLDNAGW